METTGDIIAWICGRRIRRVWTRRKHCVTASLDSRRQIPLFLVSFDSIHWPVTLVSESRRLRPRFFTCRCDCNRQNKITTLEPGLKLRLKTPPGLRTFSRRGKNASTVRLQGSSRCRRSDTHQLKSWAACHQCHSRVVKCFLPPPVRRRPFCLRIRLPGHRNDF
jgi:hypothetical protein